MALWKAGRGAQVIRLGAAIGGASDRFEAQVIRRRNPLKSLSQAPFEPCSNPLQTFPKPPWSPLKPFWSPHQAALKPSSPWSPLQALLKPLKPFWSPLQAPLEAPFTLKPHWSPSQAPLKPFWSPLEALLKPPSKPSPSSPLQALLKPPWSPLEALLKPPSSPLQAPLKLPWSPSQAPLKPPSSPWRLHKGEAPFKPPWSPLEKGLKPPLKPPLEAPLQAFWRWRVLFVLVFGSFLGERTKDATDAFERVRAPQSEATRKKLTLAKALALIIRSSPPAASETRPGPNLRFSIVITVRASRQKSSQIPKACCKDDRDDATRVRSSTKRGTRVGHNAKVGAAEAKASTA